MRRVRRVRKRRVRRRVRTGNRQGSTCMQQGSYMCVGGDRVWRVVASDDGGSACCYAVTCEVSGGGSSASKPSCPGGCGG